jgi:hypothetical protein
MDRDSPRRVQLRRTAGWRKPHDAVVVSRPTRWGNPHPVDVLGRDEAIRRYRLDLHAGRLPVTVADVREHLAGRDLACWCPLDLPCHADVLLEAANREAPTDDR